VAVGCWRLAVGCWLGAVAGGGGLVGWCESIVYQTPTPKRQTPKRQSQSAIAKTPIANSARQRYRRRVISILASGRFLRMKSGRDSCSVLKPHDGMDNPDCHEHDVCDRTVCNRDEIVKTRLSDLFDAGHQTGRTGNQRARNRVTARSRRSCAIGKSPALFHAGGRLPPRIGFFGTASINVPKRRNSNPPVDITFDHKKYRAIRATSD